MENGAWSGWLHECDHLWTISRCLPSKIAWKLIHPSLHSDSPFSTHPDPAEAAFSLFLQDLNTNPASRTYLKVNYWSISFEHSFRGELDREPTKAEALSAKARTGWCLHVETCSSASGSTETCSNLRIYPRLKKWTCTKSCDPWATSLSPPRCRCSSIQGFPSSSTAWREQFWAPYS